MPRFLAAIALLLVTLCPAAADDVWPSRVIRIVVPFGPGSTPDAAARLLADKLDPRLGQRIIIENKAGASGNLGTDTVAKAEPDGYTFGISIVGPLAINSLLFPAMPYDAARDLYPITIVGGQPSVLVVNNDVPARSVDELLALLKADPDRYTFASIGNGSLSHLAMEAILATGGVKVTHLPFASSPSAATALIRGDVQLSVLPAGGVMPLVEDGKLRALAITLGERSPLLPGLPTLKEAGITGVEADAWLGLIAPAKLPDAIADKVRAAVREALREPDMKARLQAQYIEPRGGSSEEFRAQIRDELARWAPVVKRSGIRIGQ